MYEKIEITMLYLRAKNITEVFKITEILKCVMADSKNYKHLEFIRRAANRRIVKFSMENKR